MTALLAGHAVTIAVSLAIAGNAFIVFALAWLSGQFRDVEEPKHRMMEDPRD